MPTIFHNKKVLVLIAGFALVVVGLLVFGRSASSPAPSNGPVSPFLSVAPGPAEGASAALGHDLLAALALLKTLQLDTGLFADPAFKSLTDWSKTIPPQPVGRRNPFAPLGAATVSQPASASAGGAKAPPASAPSTQKGTGATAPPASPPPASGGQQQNDADVWDFSNVDFSF